MKDKKESNRLIYITISIVGIILFLFYAISNIKLADNTFEGTFILFDDMENSVDTESNDGEN